MEKEEELFNYLNNKEYPKGSSKDDKRKLRLGWSSQKLKC